MKNDTQIKKLLKQITEKKNELGDKPRASWSTNGILKKNGSAVNINTVGEIGNCIDIVAFLLQEKGSREEAAKLLEIEVDDFMFGGFTLDSWVHDFKLRCSMLVYDKEKKKLKVLENKLKDLRSEDAKTEDALADIMNELN